MQKLISICIPTYNRSAFIVDALDSIAGQMTDDVEVVISDNASTDNTEEVIRQYLEKCPSIRYYRAKRNMGADNNFRRLLELAEGDYCWMIGDDDWILDGGIAQVIAVLKDRLKTHPDGISGLTFDFEYYTKERKLHYSPPCTGKVQELNGKDEIISYSNLGYRFGFISANIFNRVRALTIAKNHVVFKNAYLLLHIQIHLVNAYEDWVYYDAALVSWRMGNDSFMTNGFYKRFLIDMRGYEEIYADVFGKGSPIYRRFISEQHIRCCIRGYVLRAKDYRLSEQWRINRAALKNFFMYPDYWLHVFPIYFMPKFSISIGRKILKAMAQRAATFNKAVDKETAA